ncbi:MAG TPA: ATP-dependent DNA helicase UvrD2 [Acidimicrobiales bacterium]|nr:ATP-dependent DNA helicase UvrD2 [Acidimicrobiales bacterium]
MSDGGVACGYCGGRHRRAADVRACWERSLAGSAAAPAPAASVAVAAALRRAPRRQAVERAEIEPRAGFAVEPRPGSGQPAELAPSATDGGPAGASSSGPAGASSSGPVLGRSVLVAAGQPPPDPWRGCERVAAMPAQLDELERAWRERVPLVIELDDAALPGDERGGAEAGGAGGRVGREGRAAGEVERRPVWSLSPSFTFPGERLAHVVTSNAVDARGGAARFWLADEACRIGAARGGPADVVLPDGRPAWCDGGPLEWREAYEGAAVLARAGLVAGSLVPLGTNDTPAVLAPDQLAAVTHPGGAARIIAPAGSGKTRVLTERARHVLRRWGLPGRAVTLVAFNKRAADEMSERTRDLPELQVRTLNALALSLLGRSRPVATIEEREVRSILATLVDLPRRASSDPAAAWIEALSSVRLGLRPPAEVEAELGGDVDGLPEVFERYRAVLDERHAVDFDEQIYGAIEVLLADPGARRAARAACRVLLVDEFQDLTPAHLLLVRLLAGPDGAVFGVGDDDQTIYGYSGASPEWLIDYGRYFPGAGEHPLEVNYRCPPGVVAAARNLLSYNSERVPKRIVAAPGREPRPDELQVSAAGDPLDTTVEAVGALLEGGVAPADVAVLARVNASLAPVQVALVDREIPVQPAVDTSYLSRNGVQAALAWLRLAIAPAGRLRGADVALAARRPSRALSPRVVEWMGEQGSLAGLERLAGRLSGRDADKVGGFVSDLQALRRGPGRPGPARRGGAASAGGAPRLGRGAAGGAAEGPGHTATLLRRVRDEIGLDQAMELLESSHRRLDRSAQTDDLDALVALAVLHPDPEGFEAWLRRSLSAPGSPEGVQLSTIHRVKGREWPHVVLHDVSTGLLPHRLAADIEEERRVFHVGLTRGSVSVHVVAGEAPSPFVGELEQERPPLVAARAAAAAAAAAVAGRPSGAARGAVAGSAYTGRGGRPRPSGGVALRPASSAGRRPPAGAAPPEAAERARQALRAWRSARASGEGKPPYIYLHDRTLEELATRLPVSMAALAGVTGIGPGKLEAYGEELLALLIAAREGDGS